MTDYLDRPVATIPAGWADFYDETSFWSARFGALLFDTLEIEPVRDGLDVACGTGFPLIELAQVHGRESQWVGLDPWHDAVVRARKKIEAHGVRNARVEEGDAAAMPFAHGSFDLITANLGINNFDDPAAALRECYRVARPGGRIALTTNVTGHMASIYEVLRAILRDRGIDTNALDAQEQHRGTPDSIQRLMRKAGFRVTRLRDSHFELPFVNGAAMLRHSLVKWFLDGWRTAVGAQHEREVFPELERRLPTPFRCKIPMFYVEGVRP